ncbi:MAG TPA: serine hydrolase domain-containing protein [Gemmatimonadaceae bacterium]|nr:serine hydrolase domain-containing protein [Gemmatimonadaceae bacterium]
MGRRRTAASFLFIAMCACAGPRPTPAPEPGGRMRVVHDSVAGVLDRAVADSAFPGAIAVVGSRDGSVTSYAVGRIDWPAPSPAPDENTLWDLASLTKVVGMTTAMMQLVEQNRVELDSSVAFYIPEFKGLGKERVTVRHLLTHSSGLPSWRPLYKEATTPDTALAVVYTTPLDTVPGARMVYSDLGAIILGKIVERVSGESLDAYVASHITGPLGMTSTMYRPDAALRPRIAPTEFDPWRQRHIRGEVHDENAFMLGGVSGHAGLFSTAADLTRFARMLLGGGTLDGARILRPSTIAQFTAVQDPGLSHRALGWETPTGQNSAGQRMSARAFGHTGFTGTSLWIDPEQGTFVLLLSNRVNPSRQNTRIGLVRSALANAVMAAIGSGAPLTSGTP